ncbi:MAG: protein-L-isoaspartate(D-aspartate) O-methyltransferase [Salinimicrobium sediminis]|uniref:Protein-L-isoaspartate O-methyltransferase n=1 Tax=Salinimicrobium sediminis TaxID=1343891 RepID=A0A285X1D5_9FLAO|nr:protein-L-isoaspartate(D-aspartate) O-methyltransferase [Salinimicrobium sediminis]MDX1603680.1 protein-L-isoaspartate(D-aspartate) O-methyltransferase [Salinimicrobium sediminis]MDX1754262.1 protein-L-isoaspartate(D-aspartate) O-methyltransferase [Salinimicrobium sediminis]SOC78816.1 protein-L-isoaspartate(D-aspartate) O-methyltransferase [Salinimicrobium sediminis]
MKASMFFWSFILLFFWSSSSQDRFQQQRENLVKNQLIPRGIKNKAVLEAMRSVERHLMVPKDVQKHAYEDRPLPIGSGQTISQPFIVAFMTQAIQPEPGMKVLEIGTGSGYQAAVLAEIVDEVYTIETVEALGKKAEKTLTGMGYKNIFYKIGDGYHGWEEHAPFDAIIVTAAPEEIPPRLIEQLKTGGKMVIPVGPSANQHLKLIEKKKNGKITSKELLPVRFVPFTRRDN